MSTAIVWFRNDLRLAAEAPPSVGDPAVPYLGPLPAPRDAPDQEALAAVAVAEADRLLRPRKRRGVRLVRAARRFLLGPLVRVLARLTPRSWKDRLRRAAP